MPVHQRCFIHAIIIVTTVFSACASEDERVQALRNIRSYKSEVVMNHSAADQLATIELLTQELNYVRSHPAGAKVAYELGHLAAKAKHIQDNGNMFLHECPNVEAVVRQVLFEVEEYPAEPRQMRHFARPLNRALFP